MSHAIGIDIGTHASAIAVIEGGRAKVLQTRAGAGREPSWLSFTPSGPLCGERARGRAQDMPRRTMFGLLRLVGRKYFSPEMDWIRSTSALPIVSASNGDAHVQISGHTFSPTELLSHQLEHLRQRASETLKGEVERATIAVPSSFDDLQRRAIFDAAALAGFSETSLVDSTTAAALAWCVERKANRRLAVLDVGAGSFDVGIVDCDGRAAEQLAAAGDPMLGGDDMDRRVVLGMLEHHRALTGVDAGKDPAALHSLFEVARAMRRDLSRDPTAQALHLTLGDSGVLEHPGLDREQLEALVETELAGLKEPCLWAFEDAGLGTDDLDEVVLVGGLGAMPAVADLFEWLFRRSPSIVKPQDNLVARGAAHVAFSRHARAGSGALGAVALREVAAHSSGIKVRGGRFMPVLTRGSVLPSSETKVFQTSPNTKGRVVFELYQGEHEVAAENVYVGRFTLSSIDPESPFAVAFHYDDNGLLEVGQIALEDGSETPLELAHAGGLSPSDLAIVERDRAVRARARLASPSSVPRKTHRIEPSPDPGEHRPRRRTRATGALDTGARPRRHSDVPAASEPPRSPQAVIRTAPEEPNPLATSQTIAIAGPQPPPDSTTGDQALEVGSDSLVGTKLSGRYVVEEVLGEGGMGRVYLARHELLRKRFAIKVLHPELAANKDLADRFIREAQAASAIDSQHVVDISDFGQLEDGTGYFVMEHLDGRNLEELLDLEGPQPADVTIAIGVQLADALRGAHEAEIVHRDLKPSNIILLERSGQSFAKILDFGIAKSPTSDSSSHGNSVITMVGVMMGTPHYMAPEQIDGEVDPRSDVYALGVVLYEMLTGSPPFDAESIAELLAHHKWTEPPSVLETNPDAPVFPDLEAVVMKCLAKDPADRYQSAVEVAAALVECGQAAPGLRP